MAKKAKKSAAKKRAAPKAAATPAAPRAVQKDRVISTKAFDDLVRKVRNAEGEKNEAVGIIGQLVSNAVEKDRLDKKAFGIFRTLARMADDKLATTLAHLEHYLHIGGLNDRAAKQGQMFAQNPPDVGGEDAGAGAGEDGAQGDDDAPAAEAGSTNGGAKPGSFAERANQHSKAIRDAVTTHEATKNAPASEAKH